MVTDASRLRAEQDRIFRKRQDEFANIGVGVSATAQAVYDVLAKTLPCKWDNDAIIIFDAVRLAPPYDVNSIRCVTFPFFIFTFCVILRACYVFHVLISMYHARVFLASVMDFNSGNGVSREMEMVTKVLENEAHTIRSAADTNGVA